MNQRPRSTSAQRGEQNGRRRRRLAAVRPQIGQVSATRSLLESGRHGASAGSERSTRGRPRRLARAGSATGSASSAQTTSGAARSAAGAPGRRRPRCGAARPGPRRAGRPAARATADAARAPDLRQAAGGEAEQAGPRRVGARAARTASASAARRRRDRPARSIRMAPDRLRSRICRARAGSAARLAASCLAGLARRPAVAPAMSTSMATRAAVGSIWRAARRAAPPSGGTGRPTPPPGRRPRPAQRRRPRAPGAAGEQAGSSTSTGRRGGGRQPQHGDWGRAQQAGRARPGSSGRAARRGPLPPCAARTIRTASSVAHAAARGARAVGQEAVRAAERHERAGHARHHRGDPAAMHVAHAVRAARAPERVVDQHAVLHRRDPDLARAARGAHRHGRSQPWPRSSCAVSNSGSPTTPRVAAGQEAHERRPQCPGWRSRPPCPRPRRGRRRRRSAPRQPGEADHAVHHALGARPSGPVSATAVSTWWRRPDSMPRQAAPVRAPGLRQDAAAHGHHGVGGQGELARPCAACRLVARQPRGVQARRLVPQRRLVDVGGEDRRRVRRRSAPAARGGAGWPRPGSAGPSRLGSAAT